MPSSTIENALQRLAGCSRLVGREFYESIVGAMAETLSVPVVLLAQLDALDPRRARTIAVWADGGLAPNFSYDLAGTPCSDVLTGDVCSIPDCVTVLFPEDTLLSDMKARGYMGAPLRAVDGRAIGLLAAISDQPLDTPAHSRSLMEIFSGRAAAELERDATISQAEYLGRLVEGSSSEIYVFDAETLRFVLVNRGARENLGYSMEEMAALTPIDLKPDIPLDAFLALIEPLRTDSAPFLSFRTRHRRKDGSCYPVEVRLQQIRDSGAPVFFAAIEDITRRAEVEAELHATNARLRRLFSQSPAGIVETDAKGRMTLVNRRWCQMLGYSEAELLERTVFDVTHADSVPATQETIRKLIDGTDGLVIEKSYVRKDGSLVPVSSNVSVLRAQDGTFQGVAAVVVDVSERLEAERRLRDGEARLRKIIDGSQALIGILQPDGTLVEVNVPALEVGGVVRDEVIGRKFWDCAWWCYDEKVATRLRDAIGRAAAGTIQRYDEVVRTRDDGRMTIDFMLSPVFGADGLVEFLVPSGFDISERKRQEALVRDLMGEVNHRSKNLLTVVQAIARLMPKDSPEDFAEDFGSRLQALAACQDLLVHHGWQSVSLGALIQSQLLHFVDLIGRRIRLSGPDVRVSASTAQSLGMAIYELTTNAAKYGALSNATGIIEIAWTISDDAGQAPRFALTWRESGGPVSTDSSTPGFGTFVLGPMLGSRLGGECAPVLEAEGLRWSLSCPLPNLLAP